MQAPETQGEKKSPALHAVGNGYDAVEEFGDPVEVIARVADNRGYDLIVMGGRNVGVDRIF